MTVYSSSLRRNLLLVGGALLAAQASAITAANLSIGQMPGRILAAHNMVRAAAGLAPLTWDTRLQSEAARYAAQMAGSGRFAHSAPRARGGAGENLWMGTQGAYQIEEMVGGWRAEKRAFVSGVFPAVSRTGSWEDVGHYTQMVWPTTQRVGCAIAASRGADYLVCRYWPAGNVVGFPVRVAPQFASLRQGR